MLSRRGVPIASAVVGEHEEEGRMMAGALEHLNHRVGIGAPVGVDASDDALLLQRLVEVKERLSEHMLREEEAIFDSLTGFSDAELYDLVGLVLGSRSADTLATMIQMEVAHLEPDLAKHVLSTMCAVTAKTQFKAWLADALSPAAAAAADAPTAIDCKTAGDCGDSGKPAARAAKRSRASAAVACPHYGHAALVRAPCCGSFVGCHRCHDESAVCEKRMDARLVTVMRCAHCALEQPAAQHCSGCAARLGAYYCRVCRLWDESGAPTYHCPYCNICRRGHGLGVDYHHCMKCNLCVALDRLASHSCARDARCVACDDPFFASDRRVDQLLCGHAAHSMCLDAAAAARGAAVDCRVCKIPCRRAVV